MSFEIRGRTTESDARTTEISKFRCRAVEKNEISSSNDRNRLSNDRNFEMSTSNCRLRFRTTVFDGRNIEIR